MNKKKDGSKENSRLSSQEISKRVATAKGKRQLFDLQLENSITNTDKSITQIPERAAFADIS